MNFKGKRSILAISILLVLILSMSMASASEIDIEDSSVDEISSIDVENSESVETADAYSTVSEYDESTDDVFSADSIDVEDNSADTIGADEDIAVDNDEKTLLASSNLGADGRKPTNITADVPEYISWQRAYTFHFKLIDADGNIVNAPFSVALINWLTDGVMRNETKWGGSGEFRIYGNEWFNESAPYVLYASFEGNEEYAPAISFNKFRAYQRNDTRLDITYSNTTISDRVNLKLGVFNNLPVRRTYGEFEVYLNGQYVRNFYVSSSGDASLTLNGLKIGNNKISFKMKPDPDHVPVNREITVLRYAKTSTISIDGLEYLVANNDNVITFNLAESSGRFIDGSILVKVFDDAGNVIFNSNVENPSTITISSDDLVLNHTYTVNASYEGTQEIAPSNASLSFIYTDVTDTEVILPASLEPTFNLVYVEMGVKAGEYYIDSLADVYINDKFVTTIQTSSQGLVGYYIGGYKRGRNSLTVVFNGTDGLNPSNKTLWFEYYENAFDDIDCLPIALGGNLIVDAGLYDENGNILEKRYTVYLKEHYLDEATGQFVNRTVETRSIIGEDTLIFDSSIFNYTFLYDNHDYNNKPYYYIELDYEGGDYYKPINDVVYFSVVDNQTSIGVTDYNLDSPGVASFAVYLLNPDIGRLYNYPLDIFVNDVYYRTVYTNVQFNLAPVIIQGLNPGSNRIGILFRGLNGFIPAIHAFDIYSYKEEGVIFVDAPLVKKGEDAYITATFVDLHNQSRVINKKFSVLIQDANVYEHGGEGFSYKANMIGNGTVIFSAEDLAEGRYFITVDFGGDNETSSYHEDYNNSVYNSLYFDVADFVGTNISFIEHGDEKLAFGGSVSYDDLCIFSQYRNESLNVSFDVYVNGLYYSTVQTELDEDSELYLASFTIDGLYLGENTVQIIYNGSDIYRNCEKSFTVINYGNEVSINVDMPDYISIGDTLIIKVNITDSEGNILDQEFNLTFYSDYGHYNQSNGEWISDLEIIDQFLIHSSQTIELDTSLDPKATRFTIEAIFAPADDYIYSPAILNKSTKVASQSPEIIIKSDSYIAGTSANISVSTYLLDEGSYKYDSPLGPVSLDLDVYVNDEYFTTIRTSADGETLLEVSGLVKGKNTIEFRFNGTDKYNKESNSIEIETFDFDVVFEHDVHDIDVGEDAIITVKLVDANDPSNIINKTFQVTVTDNPDWTDFNYFNEEYEITGNGTIVIPARYLFEGPYYVLFDFEGDETYAPNNADVMFYVGDAPSEPISTVIDLGADEEVNGSDVTVSIALTDLDDGSFISGSVKVYLNEDLYDTVQTSEEGPIDLNISGLVIGKNIIYVVFDGYKAYQPSNSAITVMSILPPVILLPNGTIDVVMGDDGIVATLTDSDGNPIGNAIIAVDIDGAVSNRTTDNQGSIEVPIDGNATVVLSYIDENGVNISYGLKYVKEIEEVEVPVPVVARNATKIICENMVTTAVSPLDPRTGEWFTWRLVDGDGNPLKNTPMLIGFNGVIYDERNGIVTDENGYAKLQINLGYAGDYTFAICFLGNDSYNASFTVAKITVKAQAPKLTVPNKSYKATAKTKAVTATFKTVKGTPIPNAKISFTVNGKTYSAKTDAKGVVKVNVSLTKKGTYTCTAKFAGSATYKATSTKFKLTIN